MMFSEIAPYRLPAVRLAAAQAAVADAKK